MALTNREISDLRTNAKIVRRLTIESIAHAGTGHAGSSLSMIEILVLFYFKHLAVDPKHPHWEDRDRFILSKGHGAPGLYATLAHAGYFPTAEMATLRGLGSRLQGHPNAAALPGIDASTGSLGQGLSVAAGLAHGLRIRGQRSRVVCLLGDGEMQEGQNWEAFMVANALRLGNLLAVVDRNGLQNDGPTESIVPLESLVAKAEAFGWHGCEVDGHDFQALNHAIEVAQSRQDRPSLIVARTVKGKGVSFMEDQVKWHHHPLSPEEYRVALSDIELAYGL
ncbi:transketolase [Rhodopseudomonas palustris]|uniref:Transketolase subunit A n=1 Tax=Rhodopseudomonas palustris (strain BisB18) TaxID=316056 RepID=Q20ZM8_RHOPB